LATMLPRRLNECSLITAGTQHGTWLWYRTLAGCVGFSATALSRVNSSTNLSKSLCELLKASKSHPTTLSRWMTSRPEMITWPQVRLQSLSDACRREGSDRRDELSSFDVSSSNALTVTEGRTTHHVTTRWSKKQN